MKRPATGEKQLELLDLTITTGRSDGVHCPGLRHVHMLRRTFISTLVVLLATSAAVSPAFAQRDHGNDEPRKERFQRGGFPSSQWDAPQRDKEPQREVSLSSVLRDLKGRYGGQHLDAQKVGNRYIISWITDDGRRLTIEVDTATGRILSTR
jgi:uncharacterized membrane protein YkoI